MNVISDISDHETVLFTMDSLLFLNACVFIAFLKKIPLNIPDIFFGPLANLIHNKLKVLANIELSKCKFINIYKLDHEIPTYPFSFIL